jgi:aspartate 1-decarboxylase
MRRIMCKSKIHRATVTDADLNYEGSITIDPTLLEAADIREYEQVQVVNVNNGERFETYAIQGRRSSGDIVVNGAAARLVQKGDLVIIMSYCLMDDAEVAHHAPRIVFVSAANAVTR